MTSFPPYPGAAPSGPISSGTSTLRRWVRIPTGAVYPEPIPGVPYHPLHHQDKPAGFPVLEYPKGQEPPKDPPTPLTPGMWITVNAGWGAPPVYGYLARETGLESHGTPSDSSGHYISIDFFGQASWVWIPEVGKEFGK